MLNAARVVMILAGIFALPAAGCSGCMQELSKTVGDVEGEQTFGALTTFTVLAALASIAAGSFARQVKKVLTGALCFVSAIVFGLNFPMGLLSSLLALVAGVMVLVSPPSEFAGANTGRTERSA